MLCLRGLAAVGRFTLLATSSRRVAICAFKCAPRGFQGSRRALHHSPLLRGKNDDVHRLPAENEAMNVENNQPEPPSEPATAQSTDLRAEIDLLNSALHRQNIQLSALNRGMDHILIELERSNRDLKEKIEKDRKEELMNQLRNDAEDLIDLYLICFCRVPGGGPDSSPDDAWELMYDEALKVMKNVRIDKKRGAAKLRQIAAKYSMPTYIPLDVIVNLKGPPQADSPPLGIYRLTKRQEFLEECKTTDWSLLGSDRITNTLKKIVAVTKGKLDD